MIKYFIFLLFLFFTKTYASPTSIEDCVTACNQGQLNDCLPIGSGFGTIWQRFLSPFVQLESKPHVAQFKPCSKNITSMSNGSFSSSNESCELVNEFSEYPKVHIPKIFGGQINKQSGNLTVISFLDSTQTPQVQWYSNYQILQIAYSSSGTKIHYYWLTNESGLGAPVCSSYSHKL